MSDKPYYKAYDDRYRQVHGQGLRWFHDQPTPIVAQVMAERGVTKASRVLEIGCGEGRDAIPLCRQGFDVLATDVSPRAVACCAERCPEHAARFRVLDCLADPLEERFDFIYAVAVVHMLVEDAHRAGFYGFIREHLAEGGTALIGSMGDGETCRASDVRRAFDLQERVHEQTGRTLRIAGTSCRMVDFPAFLEEIRAAGLRVIRHGLTDAGPDFPVMMYAVVQA